MGEEIFKFINKTLDFIPGIFRWLGIKRLVIRDNMYWTKNNDGPYCLTCTDNNNKITRMDIKEGGYLCPECSTFKRTEKQQAEWDSISDGQSSSFYD
ncbi:MAG: hypothetical protein KMY55_15710 [Dethiosulfatibacter sp.]|nr:hypothetical protein [Dethiosulfatibacter sp.]